MENLEDTLSINHNWLNGHNVAWSVALLRRERALAAAAIDDCRQVASLCGYAIQRTRLDAEMQQEARTLSHALRMQLYSRQAEGSQCRPRRNGDHPVALL